MKIKNVNFLGFYNALSSIENQTLPLKMLKKIYTISMIEESIQKEQSELYSRLIKEHGIFDEYGQVELYDDGKVKFKEDYSEQQFNSDMMDYLLTEKEYDFEPFSESDLEDYNFTLQQYLTLKNFIA